MATTINLLPDVRLDKLRAKGRRRMAAAVSGSVIAVTLGVLAVLFIFIQAQKFKIDGLSKVIVERQTTINNTHDLRQILTTQQHLNSLPALYKQRAYLTKFYTILGTISPKDIALQGIALDGQNSFKFTVKARNYAIAAKLAKALDASNVSLGFGARESNPPHFSNVNLGAVSAETDGKVSFLISATMAPEVTNGSK